MPLLPCPGSTLRAQAPGQGTPVSPSTWTGMSLGDRGPAMLPALGEPLLSAAVGPWGMELRLGHCTAPCASNILATWLISRTCPCG